MEQLEEVAKGKEEYWERRLEATLELIDSDETLAEFLIGLGNELAGINGVNGLKYARELISFMNRLMEGYYGNKDEGSE